MRPPSRPHPNRYRKHVRPHTWATLPQLRQATLEFIDDLKSTLGISYSEHTGELSGPYTSQVDLQAIAEVHSRITRYFPRTDGSYHRLLVDAQARGGAGVYLGPRTPQAISEHISRHSLYCPKIWIPNPFCQLHVGGENGESLPNGQEAPHHWKNFTIRNGMFLSMLRPWIESGIVTCAPAMGWSDEDFLKQHLAPLSKQALTEDESNLSSEILDEIIAQVHPRLIPEIVEKLFEGHAPTELTNSISKFAKSRGRFNTFDDTRGKRELMLVLGQGETLESADAISRLISGYTLPTGLRYERMHCATKGQGRDQHAWTDVSLALADYRFNFLNSASLEFPLKIRKEGRFEKLRTHLNKTWQSTVTGTKKPLDIKSLRDELSASYASYKDDWNFVQEKMFGNLAVKSSIAFTTGAFTLGLSAGFLGAFGTTALIATQAHFERRKLRKEPLSVFIDLDQ